MAIENAFDEANKNKSLSETGVEESAGASATGAIAETLTENVSTRVGHYRWVICALLFFCDDYQLR